MASPNNAGQPSSVDPRAYSAQDVTKKAMLKVIEPDTGERIYFDYIPEEMGDDVGVDWQEVGDIIGRSAPIIGYSSTGGRTFDLSLTFVATQDVKKDVFDKVMFLQSLKYPTYTGYFMRPPPTLYLVIGDFVSMICVLGSASVSWGAPYELPSYYPMKATVGCNFKEVVETPYDRSRVVSAQHIGVWSGNATSVAQSFQTRTATFTKNGQGA